MPVTSLLVPIALGGALGATARWLLSEWIHLKVGLQFPWGTLVVNLLGCLLLGFAYGLFEAFDVPAQLRPGITVGFLGAFTTFSTFSYETLLLFDGGHPVRALAYVGVSVVLGLALAATGLGLGRAIAHSQGI